jgi:diguanylate cyclase (GGDEF)-like protein
MNNFADLDADTLVDDIYSAPAHPDFWTRVLDGLAQRVGAVGGGLLIQRNGNWLGWRASSSLEPYASKTTSKFIFARKILPERLIELNRSGFVADQELLDEREFKELAFYRELCEPLGLRHVAGTAINLPTKGIMILFVVRARDKPQFNSRDLDLLDLFRPHIARAGILTTMLGFERMRSFTEAFSLIGLPAMIVDSDCKIMAKNSYIDEHKEFIRPRKDDVLEFNNAAGTEILRETAKLLDQRISSSAKSIPILSSGGEYAIAHIIPAGSAYANFFDWESPKSSLFHSACCSVIITPIAAIHQTNKALLRNLFDLSAAETRVAEEVLNGRNTRQIAGNLGVSPETIRTHLKKIFAKTAVQTQAQLVSLLSGITKVRLENPGRHDPMTGLFNRNFGEKIVSSEFVRMKGSRQAYSILLIDIDKFRNVNNNYGHSVGDDVLKFVAKVINKTLRETDIVFRFGGEEFAAILPGTSYREAYAIAERVRLAVATSPHPTAGEIHVSIGVSEAKLDDSDEDVAILDAGEQLLAAKRGGSNQVAPNRFSSGSAP